MATVTTQTVGANVHQCRTSRGWTQQQLADACNVSRPRISEIESGNVNPSVETLEEIANQLGVKMSRLFRGC